MKHGKETKSLHDLKEMNTVDDLVYFQQADLSLVLYVSQGKDAEVTNRCGTKMNLDKLKGGTVQFTAQGYIDGRYDEFLWGDIVISDLYVIMTGDPSESSEALAEYFNMSHGGGRIEAVNQDPLKLSKHFD